MVVLPISPNARGRRNNEGGDHYRFCHDPTLDNDDANAMKIALICLGFKRPERFKYR